MPLMPAGSAAGSARDRGYAPDPARRRRRRRVGRLRWPVCSGGWVGAAVRAWPGGWRGRVKLECGGRG